MRRTEKMSGLKRRSVLPVPAMSPSPISRRRQAAAMISALRRVKAEGCSVEWGEGCPDLFELFDIRFEYFKVRLHDVLSPVSVGHHQCLLHGLQPLRDGVGRRSSCAGTDGADPP